MGPGAVLPLLPHHTPWFSTLPHLHRRIAESITRSPESTGFRVFIVFTRGSHGADCSPHGCPNRCQRIADIQVGSAALRASTACAAPPTQHARCDPCNRRPYVIQEACSDARPLAWLPSAAVAAAVGRLEAFIASYRPCRRLEAPPAQWLTTGRLTARCWGMVR